MSKGRPVKLKKGKLEIISKRKFKRIKQEFEDSVLRVWKSSKMIVPKMYLDFRIHFQEVYASTTGRIWAFTPFWRGRIFADAIMMHEFLHWAIYPIDLFRGIKDLFQARRFLAKEIKFKPKITASDLYGEIEDWSDFKYPIKFFSFCQNILGDYLINIHIHDYHPVLFKDLWEFLYHDGTFYEKQKALKRDSTFILYLSVYPEILAGLDEVNLIEKKSEEDRDKIVEIVGEVRRGRMSKVFALKELVKILSPYMKEDAKGQGKGKGQGGEPKCPACGYNEFDVTAYQDPKTGKWVKV